MTWWECFIITLKGSIIGAGFSIGGCLIYFIIKLLQEHYHETRNTFKTHSD